jgi:AAA domain/Toprim-like
VADVSTFTKDALAYFESHAIDPEVALKLRVREQGNAIVFPCTDADGNPTPRRRLLHPRPGERKVRGKTGVPLGVTVWRPPANGKLLLCEGEGDALAAYCADVDGYGIASIPGVGFPAERLATTVYGLGVEGVVLGIDADKPGDAFVARAARRLAQVGAEVRRLQLDRGQDLADALVAGADLPGLLNAATAVEVSKPKRATAGRVTMASEVRARRVEWLIPDRVPIGGVTLLAGDPKLGKSTLSCTYAAWLSREGIVTLFASAEDSFDRITKPRLVAADADLDRVGKFEVVDDVGARNFDLPDDVDTLAAMVRESGARLVVIDPLNAHLSGSIDSWKDHGIRRALAPLARLADELDIAVIVVAHLNKQRGGDPLYRVGGSIGNVAAARSVLAFGRNPEDPHGERGVERLLAHAGCNWGPIAATQVYELQAAVVEVDGEVHDTSRLLYLRDSESSAAEAFGVAAREDRGQDAEEAIGEALKDGPRPSREVKTEVMAELNVGLRTVERVAGRMVERDELLVNRSGFPSITTWELRPHSPAKPITQDGGTGGGTGETQSKSQIPQSRHSPATDGNGDGGTGEVAMSRLEEARARGEPKIDLAEAFGGEWVEPPRRPRAPHDRRGTDRQARAFLRARRRHAFTQHPHAALFAQRWAQRADATGEVDPHLACRGAYCCPVCAAEILGVSRQRLAALRRAVTLTTIGMAPAEYRAARERAGWMEGEQAWGPGVFYLRADL